VYQGCPCKGATLDVVSPSRVVGVRTVEEGIVNTSWCRSLSRPIVAAALLVSVAACGGSQPTATATASPGPAGATQSPGPAPTPIATPSPTPTPSAVPPPAAPGALNWELPCLITITCTDQRTDPIDVTWTPSAGPVDGYRLYYTTGVVDLCAGTWTADGTATLIGSLDSTTHSWSGPVPRFGGKLSVVAFTGGSSSEATFSSPVDVTEPMCPPA
jgi:hypothetical protein